MKILLDRRRSRDGGPYLPRPARAWPRGGESHDGIEGLRRASVGEHAALIVDRMLPGLDGLSLVRQLRAEGSQTPVLFLTTMSGMDDRVEGLEGGGDDYLVKPFAFAELLARVNAITAARREAPAGHLAGRRPGNGPDPPHRAPRRQEHRTAAPGIPAAGISAAQCRPAW